MDEDVEDFLAHYGVLGMKWGVRRREKARARGDAVKRTVKKTYRKMDDISKKNKAVRKTNRANEGDKRIQKSKGSPERAKLRNAATLIATLLVANAGTYLVLGRSDPSTQLGAKYVATLLSAGALERAYKNERNIDEAVARARK